jgi:hypothetical protein
LDGDKIRVGLKKLFKEDDTDPYADLPAANIRQNQNIAIDKSYGSIPSKQVKKE